MTHWTGVCATVCIGQLSSDMHKSSTIDVPDTWNDLIRPYPEHQQHAKVNTG